MEEQEEKKIIIIILCALLLNRNKMFYWCHFFADLLCVLCSACRGWTEEVLLFKFFVPLGFLLFRCFKNWISVCFWFFFYLLFTSSWLYICILPQRKHHLCEEKFALHWQVSTSLLPSPLQTKLEWSVLVSVSFKLGSPETNKSVLKCCPVFLFGVFFQLILCHV